MIYCEHEAHDEAVRGPNSGSLRVISLSGHGCSEVVTNSPMQVHVGEILQRLPRGRSSFDDHALASERALHRDSCKLDDLQRLTAVA